MVGPSRNTTGGKKMREILLSFVKPYFARTRFRKLTIKRMATLRVPVDTVSFVSKRITTVAIKVRSIEKNMTKLS
jgi:hypothetical protein